MCAGWSEPLLVSHITLLEISCHGCLCSIISPSGHFAQQTGAIFGNIDSGHYKEDYWLLFVSGLEVQAEYVYALGTFMFHHTIC